MSHSQPLRHVVVGAGGTVGAAMVDQLEARGASVVGIDIANSAGSASLILDDALNLADRRSTQAIQAADVVVLALSESVIKAAAPAVLRIMKRDALLLHTASVQGPLASYLAGLSAGTELVGINPMFSPNLGFAGRTVGWIPIQAGRIATLFEAEIASWGCRLERFEAQEHDRVVAHTQVAVHAAILAFGAVIANSGFDQAKLASVATPPFDTLLCLLARILGGAREVYWEIQSENPMASSLRQELLNRFEALSATCDEGGAASFSSQLDAMASFFGPGIASYQRKCQELFSLGSRLG